MSNIPKRPKPNVDTLRGNIEFRFDEELKDWVPVFEPQTLLEKLLRQKRYKIQNEDREKLRRSKCK